MQLTESAGYIVDANVLIDYLNSDVSILALLSSMIGQLYIARSVFEEVRELSTKAAGQYNMLILTPSLELALEANSKRGRLSYQDHETLLLAIENDLTCITNDRELRLEAETEGVSLMWGLETMKTLVSLRLISKSVAKKTAHKIHLTNPRYISTTILDEFSKQIDDIVV